MSGPTDTSTPAIRQAFVRAITSGNGGASLPAAVAAVANCSLPVPDVVAALLNLPGTATYAQAASQMQGRWANGQAAF